MPRRVCAVVVSLTCHCTGDDTLARLFNEFDGDGSGSISWNELRMALAPPKPLAVRAELRKLVRTCTEAVWNAEALAVCLSTRGRFSCDVMAGTVPNKPKSELA